MRDHRKKINTFTQTQTLHHDPTSSDVQLQIQYGKFSTYLHANYEAIDQALISASEWLSRQDIMGHSTNWSLTMVRVRDGAVSYRCTTT
jgi:hypothetical protein